MDHIWILNIENGVYMAKNGTIGLESAYGALMTVLPLEKV
jgi:hypothetical protein